MDRSESGFENRDRALTGAQQAGEVCGKDSVE